MTVSGMLLADDRLETTVKGLFAGNNFEFLRRDVLRLRGGVPCRERCGVHRDGRHRRRGSRRPNTTESLAPLGAQGTNLLKYNDFEDPIRQIMDYCHEYRRNMAGMRLALESSRPCGELHGSRAANSHELMRLHEAFDLLELCRAIWAVSSAKESGRGMYQLSVIPKRTELAKGAGAHPQGRVPVQLDGVIPHLSQGETTCLRF